MDSILYMSLFLDVISCCFMIYVGLPCMPRCASLSFRCCLFVTQKKKTRVKCGRRLECVVLQSQIDLEFLNGNWGLKYFGYDNITLQYGFSYYNSKLS